MVLLSFSYPTFSGKIPNGSKICTTRLFKPKRFKQFLNNNLVHLYWKSRTKEKKFFGKSPIKSIFFIHFVRIDLTNEQEIDEELYSLIVENYAYNVEISSYKNYFYEMDSLGSHNIEWTLMDHNWVNDYCKKEGFDSYKDIATIFDFITKRSLDPFSFFFTVEWEFPFLPERRKLDNYII